jgi:hypothetical protein
LLNLQEISSKLSLFAVETLGFLFSEQQICTKSAAKNRAPATALPTYPQHIQRLLYRDSGTRHPGPIVDVPKIKQRSRR